MSDPEYKITPAEEIPDYVTAMKYAEKWQKDGIIWKDVLNDQTDRNALLNEGKIITFGEIMLRLSPENSERFTQCHSFEPYTAAEKPTQPFLYPTLVWMRLM